MTPGPSRAQTPAHRRSQRHKPPQENRTMTSIRKTRTTTAKPDTTGAPVKPMTLLERVAEERRLHSERVTALLTEANALAQEAALVEEPLATLTRLRDSIGQQHQELANQRDLAARVARDAQAMRDLNLATDGGEDER